MEVITALSKVMGELPAIGKDAKSHPRGYSYRGIEAITKHLQPLLAKHGVIIVPNASITSVVASPEMKPGWQDVYATVEWTIYGPDGSEHHRAHERCRPRQGGQGCEQSPNPSVQVSAAAPPVEIADKADDSPTGSPTNTNAAQAPQRPLEPSMTQ
jgi:hypothetical protein